MTQSNLNRTLGIIGLILTIVLLLGAIAAKVGQNFVTNQISNQLSREKISFPPLGSPELDPKTFPSLQQYAGQKVDTGFKAKAYADDFIWVHMMKASNNKTYAEVSSLVKQNPNDIKLANLKNTLFQGDMLRSSLLTAYAFSVMGIIAGWAFYTLIALSVIVFTLSTWYLAKTKNQK